MPSSRGIIGTCSAKISSNSGPLAQRETLTSDVINYFFYSVHLIASVSALFASVFVTLGLF